MLNFGSKSTLVDYLPINILTCDPNNFIIDYANKQSIETLNELSELLPAGVNGDSIIGQNIDVFHETPMFQRKLLSDPSIYPHKAVIRLGDEYLDLYIDAIISKNKINKLVLSWNICTERKSLKIMVDKMPNNVMMADPKTFKIKYVNETSRTTLKAIEHLLPIELKELDGVCIDVFHKKPQRIRNILSDPSNLPHKAKITLGDQKLSLNVSAIQDEKGHYIGPMVVWDVITEEENMALNVKEMTDIVAQTAEELQQTAGALSAGAEETSCQSTAVASASEEASANVQTVASAAEEMSSSINEITKQISNANKIALGAVEKAETTNTVVVEMGQAAQKVGDVISLINDIAEQTNLLALNATIEAARAGDAGKGFSVVASEVKSLAAQTAKATEEISHQIQLMQGTSQEAIKAIQEISNTINEIGDTSSAIAAAIEEQAATTKEIARNVQEASTGTAEVSQNIVGVQQAANETGSASSQLVSISNNLNDNAKKMSEQITAFLERA